MKLFLKLFLNVLPLLLLGLVPTCTTAQRSSESAESAETVPQNAIELWEDVDFHSDMLDTEIVEEWINDGIVCRYVIFTVGNFKGAKSSCAAFYTFPEGMKNGPAFVWAHGGGQRADRERGIYFAQQGYATLDINWGGREMVEGISANTDWGNVDPSQGPKFYPGAKREHSKHNLQPDEFTIDSFVSPRNSSWYLLAYAGRRAITFLEQQPEVDAAKIGFTGYSMGGNITSNVAIDPRLKAVIPMVGGTGFITDDFPGLPETGKSRSFKDVELFNNTIDARAYWPHVKCPVVFLSASDDFHAVFERVFKAANLIPHENWHTSHLMHYNHSLGAKQWVIIDLLFGRYLKGEAGELPKTVVPSFNLNAAGDRAEFEIKPDRVADVTHLEIFYSHDPNARSRFWLNAQTERVDDAWVAQLPVRENLPLYAFANITYSLDKATQSFGGETETFTITSDEAVYIPAEVKADQLRANAKPMPVFHDFDANGIQGWAPLPNGGISTYKFQDPRRKTPSPEQALRLTVKVPRERLSYRIRITKRKYLSGVEGPKETFSFSRNLKVGDSELVLRPSDFKNDTDAMKDWSEISTFRFSIYDGQAKRSLEFSDPDALSLIRRMEWVEQ